MIKMDYVIIFFLFLIIGCTRGKNDGTLIEQQHQKINLFPENETEIISDKMSFNQALLQSDYTIYTKDIILIDSSSMQRGETKFYVYSINQGRVIKKADTKSTSNKKNKEQKGIDNEKLLFFSSIRLYKNVTPKDSIYIFLKLNNNRSLIKSKLGISYEYIENTPL